MIPTILRHQLSFATFLTRLTILVRAFDEPDYATRASGQATAVPAIICFVLCVFLFGYGYLLDVAPERPQCFRVKCGF
jgi:hypothetical protein